MSAADWISAVGTIALPILLAIWGTLQWRFDRRLQENQKIEEARQARARENEQAAREERRRDVQLTDWGMNVVALMAELEGFCRPLGENLTPSSSIADIAWRASALVDQGRLFFPNVPTAHDYTGYRPQILDEVVRAAYVARTLASGLPGDTDILRRHVYAARRRFISVLQEKVRRSLYDAGDEDAGDSIPRNPFDWPHSLASYG